MRAIRALLKEGAGTNPFAEAPDVAFKDDFPKWLVKSQPSECVTIEANIEIDKIRDAGLFQSTLKQLTIETQPDTLTLLVTISHGADVLTQNVQVRFDNRTFTGLEAQEVLSRIQSANSVVFHNSTQAMPRFFYQGGMHSSVMRDLSSENELLLTKTKKTVNNALKKVAKGRQKEFEELLGKLEQKYKVGLSLPTFELTQIPYSITLGENAFQVRLDDWGSGTRNRTQILLALFAAKKISESDESASKTTPIIIIEEPECFLHPSAQSEFGRVIRDLAEEFQIQVIMTTHSPYMLSLKSQQSNILLKRRSVKGQDRETELIGIRSRGYKPLFIERLLPDK